MRRLGTVVATTLVVLGCALGSAADEIGRHFLWKATAPTGTVVWLMGSMHALPKSALPLPDVFDRAFADAEVLVLEVDMEELKVAGTALLTAGSLPPGEHLADVLTPETRAALETYLGQNGYSMSSFEMMRPWMAAIALTQLQLMRKGFSADSGLDQMMYRRAAETGLPVVGLETARDQIDLFATMSPEEADAFLRAGLEDLEMFETELERLTAAWATGDVKTVLDLSSAGYEAAPDLYRRLIDDRNESWYPQVKTLLEGDRDALVVVGALHLVGETGLVTKLRAEGFDVAQH